MELDVDKFGDGEMIRILYLNPVGIHGGAERVLLGLLAQLNRRDYSPIVLAPEGPLGAKVMELDVPFVSLALPKRLTSLSLRGARTKFQAAFTSLPEAVRVIAAMRKKIRQIQPRLIHSNGIKAHVLGSIVGKIAGVQIVWHFHDFLGCGRWERAIATLGRLSATRIIAVSEAVRESLVAQRLGHKTVTITNGIDLQTFRPGLDAERVRQEFGIARDIPWVGIIGMLTPWKGQEVFLRAAAAVHAQNPTVRFLIVGDEVYRTAGHGSFRQQLERQVAVSGLRPWVTFTGLRQDIAHILTALDVVVHASVRPEPFGLIVLEAMACGRPVIATRAGGIPEVIGMEEQAGLFVPPGDSHTLAETILSLVHDQKRRQALGRAGRQRAESSFDIQLHAQRVEGVYRDILEKT